MPAAELLDLLVCPETKMSLRLADEDILSKLNEAIASGQVKTRGGDTVGTPLDAGLIREDGQLLYPIRDEIPIMLLDDAIPLGSTAESVESF